MNIETFAPNHERLAVTWSDGQRSEFHYVWLRDNCPCDLCRHPQVDERTLDSISIPLDIAPKSVNLNAAGGLVIIWNNDEHETVYAAAWLHRHTYEPEARAARRFRPTLWDASLTGNLPEVTYESVMADEAGVLTWLQLLREYGVTMVRGVPTEKGHVAKVAERIAFLRETNFGVIFDVESMPDPNSVAYTALRLPAHIDLVSRESPPGLQFLHCLVFGAIGGESLLVDGFRVAEELRQRDPPGYALLTATPLPFRYQDRETDLRFKSPVIHLDADGGFFEIRYSNGLQAPLDVAPDLMLPIYKAYFNFVALLRDPKFEVHLRLEPGDLMVFNNRRVLHGRESFDLQSGPRHLQGCYIATDDFMSRLRVLERTPAHQHA